MNYWGPVTKVNQSIVCLNQLHTASTIQAAFQTASIQPALQLQASWQRSCPKKKWEEEVEHAKHSTIRKRQ